MTIGEVQGSGVRATVPRCGIEDDPCVSIALPRIS